MQFSSEALDRYITGNYGEDQFRDGYCVTHDSPWPDEAEQCNHAAATDKMMKHFECEQDLEVDEVSADRSSEGMAETAEETTATDRGGKPLKRATPKPGSWLLVFDTPDAGQTMKVFTGRTAAAAVEASEVTGRVDVYPLRPSDDGYPLKFEVATETVEKTVVKALS
jgi:hypothetical protein